MKLLSTFVVLLSALVAGSYAWGTSSVILPPIKEGQEIALIVVPGAYIRGEEYWALGQYIQQSSPHKLWVALTTDYRRDFPGPPEVGQAIDKALSTLREQGMKTDLIFMAGHSAGGTELQRYVHGNAESVTGMLLWASYLSAPERKLQNFPVPLTLISGDLDGLTRITKISNDYEELRSVEKDQRAYTPVVVIEGTNHGQFATGEMPENVLKNDLTPDLSLEEALKKFAEISSYFMSSLVSDGKYNIEAREYVNKEWDRTEQLLNPLMDAHAMEELDGQSPWTAVVQKLIAGQASDKTDVVDKLVSRGLDFSREKPSLIFTNDTSGGRLTVSTFSQTVDGGSLIDVSQWYFSAEEISSKLKRRGAIDEHISTGYRRDIPCSDFNQESISWAFAASSNSTAFGRYMARGKRMVLGADTKAADESQWDSSSLVYNTTATGELEVKSTIWLSDSLSLPSNAQMHYCRLLSPFKVLEWMYVDSLR